MSPRQQPDRPDGPTLFDERSDPDFRTVYGGLLGSATHVDVALSRIRLGSMDFRERELTGLVRLRLLLRQLNAAALDAEAYDVLTDRSRAEFLLRLAARLDAGVIELRASPLGGWSPGFSVFYQGERARAVLLGPHRFHALAERGPAFVSLHGEDGARLASRRFEEAWGLAHDISDPVRTILERVRKPRALPQTPAERTRRIPETPTVTTISGPPPTPENP